MTPSNCKLFSVRLQVACGRPILLGMRQPLSQALGKVLRGIREQHGARQDDLARAARAAGVRWTASSVASLETGRRALTIDETVRLPAILHQLGVPAAAASRTSGQSPLKVLADANDILIVVCGREVVQDTGQRWEKSIAQIQAGERAVKAFPRVTKDVMAAARADEDGVLEQRIARRFKVDPLTVAVAARLCWGRGLSEERDLRSAEAAAGVTRRVAQTIRGHVTRQLVAELEPDLRRVPRRQRARQRS
jgi:transcriptional regulator with XRE-family HTH domain